MVERSLLSEHHSLQA